MTEPVPVDDQAVGLTEPTINPFASHVAFARDVRGGTFQRPWYAFLDAMREPIDVRADRIIDIHAFGNTLQLIAKPPRMMRDDEYPTDIEDRMKADCERQFVLRNIARLEKEAYPNEKLEFDHKPVDAGGFEFPELASMAEAYAAPELLPEVSYQFVYNASHWRWTLLEIMQWERYFCKEIKDKFPGAMWKHDPDTNPIPDERPAAEDAGPNADSDSNPD